MQKTKRRNDLHRCHRSNHLNNRIHLRNQRVFAKELNGDQLTTIDLTQRFEQDPSRNSTQIRDQSKLRRTESEGQVVFKIFTHLGKSSRSEIGNHELSSIRQIERFDPSSAHEGTRTDRMRLDAIGHEGLVRDVHCGARTGECFVVRRLQFIENGGCDVSVDDNERSWRQQGQPEQIVEENWEYR